MKKFPLWFSPEKFTQPDDHVIDKLNIKEMADAPAGTKGEMEVRYKGKDGLLLGTTLRKMDSLVTLEASWTHPRYKFGDFTFNPKCALGREMVYLGVELGISDYNRYINMLQKQFDKATAPRDKNDDPFKGDV